MACCAVPGAAYHGGAVDSKLGVSAPIDGDGLGGELFIHEGSAKFGACAHAALTNRLDTIRACADKMGHGRVSEFFV